MPQPKFITKALFLDYVYRVVVFVIIYFVVKI